VLDEGIAVSMARGRRPAEAILAHAQAGLQAYCHGHVQCVLSVATRAYPSGALSKEAKFTTRSHPGRPGEIKIGKAILYPLEELDGWDRRNLVVCRPSRSLPLEEAAE
jgi:hypothetical protein